MNNHKSVLGLLVVVLVCLSAAAQAQAPQAKLKFTFNDVTISGTEEVDSYGINNNGVVTGDYIESDGVTWHGFYCKLNTKGACGKVTNIDDTSSGATKTQGYGINSSGEIVGYYLNSSGLDQGFLYKGGTFTDIGPSGDISIANGINDKGLIVGGYTDSSSGVQYGFLYDGTTYTQLAPSGCAGTTTAAWGINNKDWITIYCINTSGVYDSFLTKDKGKTFKKIDVPNATQSVVHTINNAGNIVYTIFDSSGYAHGVLYYGGKYTQFDDPKESSSAGTRGDGLNSKLVILGRYGAGPTGGNGGFGYEAIVKK
jgi:probable HAF family extracellular repeat protein